MIMIANMWSSLSSWFRASIVRGTIYVRLDVNDPNAPRHADLRVSRSKITYRFRAPKKALYIRDVVSESSDEETDDEAAGPGRHPANDLPRIAVKTVAMENSKSDNCEATSNEGTDESGENRSVTAEGSNECRAGSYCSNCETIMNVSECAVCLNPLQGLGLWSCTMCANFICNHCFWQISSCAFCRAREPMYRNKAIERLLVEMYLPCRNVRYGCGELMNADMRHVHERECSFRPVQCPVIRRSCGWSGGSDEILTHMEKVHNILPTPTRRITIQFTQLDVSAVFLNDGPNSNHYVTCYGQLFAIRLRPKPTKLVLGFFNLGPHAQIGERSPPGKYFAEIKAKADNGKVVDGTVNFYRSAPQTQEVSISSDFVYRSWDKSKPFIKTVDIVIDIKKSRG